MTVNESIRTEIKRIRELLTSLSADRWNSILQNMETANSDFAYELMQSWRRLFNCTLAGSGDQEVATQILRKFNDAGRRSPPWLEGSSHEGARRPQDGANGNRRNRWEFDPSHEFYATKTMACLVELKFVLQAFSMINGPPLPSHCDDLIDHPILVRVLGHGIRQGEFLDPLTRDPPDFREFKRDRRYIEAGHITPHGRGGRHTVENATLALRLSNRMQGDLTIPEALNSMVHILRNNNYTVTRP